MGAAKVISVINYKGGVGKTTSAYNIGVGLNFLTDSKVLLVDLDPQCSLTNIGLKAYSKATRREFKIEDLSSFQSINYVIRSYLKQITHDVQPKINYDDIVVKNFYQGKYYRPSNMDLLPATMFDTSESSYPKGLDDLEIEMAMNYVGEGTRLKQLSLFAKFFTEHNIKEKYDFIIFDCPPANNLITQNALIVSDYYIIPTIMDDLSTNGITHLHNLIQKTIFEKIHQQYGDIINQHLDTPHYQFFHKAKAELLGIFETLKKATTDTNFSRRTLQSLPYFSDKLLSNTIYHHVDTARHTGGGQSVFSVFVDKNKYSPHVCYGELILEILDKIGFPYNEEDARLKINNWL
ncbi:ParA family protein [Brevibacillus dissolubilis]|uniref:ParA family protein n=1 Tax=Brevibacillus dissolubilis TaxID=1844116 RepID=UPI0011164D9C|nr:AAA family ATPase [Brevibacillus dissolubilis]